MCEAVDDMMMMMRVWMLDTKYENHKRVLTLLFVTFSTAQLQPDEEMTKKSSYCRERCKDDHFRLLVLGSSTEHKKRDPFVNECKPFPVPKPISNDS